MNRLLGRARSFVAHVVVVAGVVASVATSPADTGVSGVTDSESILLTGDEPEITVTAAAVLVFDSAAAVTSGDIGLNVQPDGDANGSLAFTLEGNSGSATGDIVDTQSQGATRIAVDAFSGCNSECTEELTITFTRTDDALEGDLGFIWSLDAFAAPDAETTGTIEFTID
jgi:hypothetical protein